MKAFFLCKKIAKNWILIFFITKFIKITDK